MPTLNADIERRSRLLHLKGTFGLFDVGLYEVLIQSPYFTTQFEKTERGRT